MVGKPWQHTSKESKKILRHVCVDIAGLERIMRKKVKVPYLKNAWQLFNHEDGPLLTFDEVLVFIEQHKKLGHKVITTCDRIDSEGRCEGHEIIDQV